MKEGLKKVHTIIVTLVIITVFSGSCMKKEVPVLKTWDVLLVTISSAVSGGTIVDEGSSTVISLGVCWSTEPGPTIQDFKTLERAGQTQYSSSLKGLIGGTKYYVRAYAINDIGIGYGNEVTFTTL
ncbi:MAG TPA: hypothetical protein VMV47_09390 [Bacteroidales bacterium]|nr:hypothetical protein [Bacteroidales bacterium]